MTLMDAPEPSPRNWSKIVGWILVVTAIVILGHYFFAR